VLEHLVIHGVEGDEQDKKGKNKFSQPPFKAILRFGAEEVFKESGPTFDDGFVVRARYTTEERLMVDLAAARQGFRKRDITNVCLIRSEHNVADTMTKFSANSSLLQLIKSHFINHPIELYVLEYDRIHERAETSQHVCEFLPESRTHSAQPHRPEVHSAQNV
jgi:hypothetical protein